MKNTSSSLVAMAQSAAQQAYVPYSKFKVGAVLSFANGATVTGCNIENVSYGLTNCAERTAILVLSHKDLILVKLVRWWSLHQVTKFIRLVAPVVK